MDVQIFDECHHTLHNHPFKKVAERYQQLPPEQHSKLQVLTTSYIHSTYVLGRGLKLLQSNCIVAQHCFARVWVQAY